MSETIKQTEARPETLPDSVAGIGLPEARLVWERIEAHISHRWTPREVFWIVEGTGEWSAPLAPATIEAVEIWDGGAWAATTLGASPLGLDLPSTGPYRITATVGDGGAPVPLAVTEAFDRLRKYFSAIERTPGPRLGYRQMTLNKYDSPPPQQTPMQDTQRVQEVDGGVDYIPNWPAKAMQLSGAADLLRPYRRA